MNLKVFVMENEDTSASYQIQFGASDSDSCCVSEPLAHYATVVLPKEHISNRERQGNEVAT